MTVRQRKHPSRLDATLSSCQQCLSKVREEQMFRSTVTDPVQMHQNALCSPPLTHPTEIKSPQPSVDLSKQEREGRWWYTERSRERVPG